MAARADAAYDPLQIVGSANALAVDLNYNVAHGQPRSLGEGSWLNAADVRACHFGEASHLGYSESISNRRPKRRSRFPPSHRQDVLKFRAVEPHHRLAVYYGDRNCHLTREPHDLAPGKGVAGDISFNVSDSAL